MCELHFIGIKCGLGTQNLVRYTGVLVMTGFIISRFLPMQITVALPGPKKHFVTTGTSI